MGEQTAIEVITQVMSDETLLQLEINIRGAWLILSALQLATRHPELHEPLINGLRKIGAGFADAICERHPEAAELIEMSWRSEYDYIGDEKEGGNLLKIGGSHE
jgi:hypothetical protein